VPEAEGAEVGVGETWLALTSGTVADLL